MAPKKKGGKQKADMEDIDETNKSGSGSPGAAIEAPSVADAAGSKAGSNEAGNKEVVTGVASEEPQTLQGVEEIIKAADGSRVVHSTPSAALDDKPKVDSTPGPPSALASFKLTAPADSQVKEKVVTDKALAFFEQNKQKFGVMGFETVYDIPLGTYKQMTKTLLKQILADEAVRRELDEGEEEESEEEEEEDEEEEEHADPAFDFKDSRGEIKNYLDMPNVGTLEGLATNAKKRISELNEELSSSNYMTGVVEVGDVIKLMPKTKDSKDTINAYNFALEVIEKLQTGSGQFNDTFVKTFAPAFAHFGVLPNMIREEQGKLAKIADAMPIVEAKEDAKKKKNKDKKLKQKQKRALDMSSGVEASDVGRKRGKSVAGSAFSALMLSYKQ